MLEKSSAPNKSSSQEQVTATPQVTYRAQEMDFTLHEVTDFIRYYYTSYIRGLACLELP